MRGANNRGRHSMRLLPASRFALTWALGNAEPGGLKRAAKQMADVILDGMRVAPSA